MEKTDQLFIIGGLIVIALIFLFLLWNPGDLAGEATRSGSVLTRSDTKPDVTGGTRDLTSGAKCFVEYSLFPDPTAVPDRLGRVTYTYQKAEGRGEITIESDPLAQVEHFPDAGVFKINNNYDFTVSCPGAGRFTYQVA